MKRTMIACWLWAGALFLNPAAYAKDAPAPRHALTWISSDWTVPETRIASNLDVGAYSFYGLNSGGLDRITFLANSASAAFVAALNIGTATLVGKTVVGQPQEREYRGISGPVDDAGLVFASTVGPISAYDLKAGKTVANFPTRQGIKEPAAADSMGGYSVLAFEHDTKIVAYLVKGTLIDYVTFTLGDKLEAVSIGDITNGTVHVAFNGKSKMAKVAWNIETRQNSVDYVNLTKTLVQDPDQRWAGLPHTDGWVRANTKWTCCSWTSPDHAGVLGLQLERRIGTEHDATVVKLADRSVNQVFIHPNGGTGIVMDIEGDCRGTQNHRACYLAVSLSFRKMPDGIDKGYVVFLDGNLKPMGHYGGNGMIFHDLMRMPDGSLAAVGSNRKKDSPQEGIFYRWQNAPYGAAF